MGPFSSAAMPDDDDIVILGNPTLQMLGMDIYESLRVRTRGFDCSRYSGIYRQCRRVTASVEALQQRPGQQQEEPDVALARMVARGPDTDMNPAEEFRERSAALEGAVEAFAAAGFEDSHVGGLRGVIGKPWNAFRRGVHVGEPPALVEPLLFTL